MISSLSSHVRVSVEETEGGGRVRLEIQIEFSSSNVETKEGKVSGESSVNKVG